MLIQFFETNKIILKFIYPLIFFLMGFGILLKNTRHSRFRLAKSLTYLALFGILHGVSDWGGIFIPIQRSYLNASNIFVLQSIKIALTAISFYFFFYFGLDLLVRTQKWSRKITAVPLIMLGIWFAAFILLEPFLVNPGNHEWWFAISDIWSRYLLAVPGGIISSIALCLQKQDFENFGEPLMTKTLLLAVASLVLYTVVGGLIVPYAPVLPALLFNSDVFFQTIGIPVEFFRALSGLLMSVLVLYMLRVFDLEYQEFYSAVQKEKALLEERVKIARDLHDGLIQSIYAAGLHLERVLNLLTQKYGEASAPLDAELQGIINRLNKIIREIREYIHQLKMPVSAEVNLKEEIERLIEELNFNENLEICADYLCDECTWSMLQTPQISFIIKEALSNILRHAKATLATVTVDKRDGKLVIEVTDNGQGFNLTNVVEENDCFKQGIKNMMERSKTIGGELWISTDSTGTKVHLLVPPERGLLSRRERAG